MRSDILSFLSGQSLPSGRSASLGVLARVLHRTLLASLFIVTSFGMALFLNPRPLVAQPEYRMFGIRNQSSLVELNPTSFNASFVSNLSVPDIQGLAYDSVNGRLLALSGEGVVYSVDNSSGVLTMVANFTELYDSGDPYSGLTFDQGVNPRRLYVVGNFFPTRLIGSTQSGQNFQLPSLFEYQDDSLNFSALSIRPSDGQMFLLDAQGNSLRAVNKESGEVSASLPSIGPNAVEDIAFHPSTGVLYGVSSSRLFEINSVTGAGNVVRTYSPGDVNPTNALAFVPIPPTPTPTPTATPTATPCPESLDQCACGNKPIVLLDGQQVCAPLSTLTRRTVPEAPQVSVTGRTVTLFLEDFDAVTDGRLLEILRRIRGQALLPETVLEARRTKKLSIRYETRIKRRGSRTLDNSLRITKRNKVTIRNVSAGRYTARYRVRIQRGDRVVGKSRLSPPTGFKMPPRIGRLPR